MRISVLGWGSLVWRPDGYLSTAAWETGGPNLRVEFSRLSGVGSGQRFLSLVIHHMPDGTSNEDLGALVPTRFADVGARSLDDAIGALRRREGTVRSKIGYVNLKNGQRPDEDSVEERVWQWADSHDWDAVIWTHLESNFDHEVGKRFSTEAAFRLLRCQPVANLKKPLSLDEQFKALEYIERAPREVQTPLRKKATEYFDLDGGRAS